MKRLWVVLFVGLLALGIITAPTEASYAENIAVADNRIAVRQFFLQQTHLSKPSFALPSQTEYYWSFYASNYRGDAVVSQGQHLLVAVDIAQNPQQPLLPAGGIRLEKWVNGVWQNIGEVTDNRGADGYGTMQFLASRQFEGGVPDMGLYRLVFHFEQAYTFTDNLAVLVKGVVADIPAVSGTLEVKSTIDFDFSRFAKVRIIAQEGRNNIEATVLCPDGTNGEVVTFEPKKGKYGVTVTHADGRAIDDVSRYILQITLPRHGLNTLRVSTMCDIEVEGVSLHTLDLYAAQGDIAVTDTAAGVLNVKVENSGNVTLDHITQTGPANQSKLYVTLESGSLTAWVPDAFKKFGVTAQGGNITLYLPDHTYKLDVRGAQALICELTNKNGNTHLDISGYSQTVALYILG